MNKIHTAFLAGLLSLGMSAHAGDTAQNYIDRVGVGFAVQDVPNNDKFDPGTALILNAGKDIYSDMSVEIEGAVGLTKPEAKFNGKTHEVDFWSLGLYGTYIWKINKLSIKPRIGVVYESIKSTLNIHTNNEANMESKVRKKDLALSGGIGAAYDIGENYKIYTNYTKYEDDIDQLTFGAEYKF